jgi:hypothetical protein
MPILASYVRTLFTQFTFFCLVNKVFFEFVGNYVIYFKVVSNFHFRTIFTHLEMINYFLYVVSFYALLKVF